MSGQATALIDPTAEVVCEMCWNPIKSGEQRRFWHVSQHLLTCQQCCDFFTERALEQLCAGMCSCKFGKAEGKGKTRREPY